MKDPFKKILQLIFGDVIKAQRSEVIESLKDDNQLMDWFRKTKVAWALLMSEKKLSERETGKAYQKVAKELHFTTGIKTAIPLHRLLLRYASIAAILTGIIFSITLLLKETEEKTPLLVTTTIIAEKGQISSVILPDSTQVWLNSGSTLQYDNQYSVKNRNLTVNGQAYLKVRKNVKLPLLLKTSSVLIRVLGTQFDVSAYPNDKQVRVYLESGKIDLSVSGTQSKNYIMKPGQIAVYEPGIHILKIERVAESESQWKEGALVFSETPMHDVLNRLRRKFNVDIQVTDSSVYKSVLNARFREENIREILDYIQISCPVTYTADKQSGRYLIRSKPM